MRWYLLSLRFKLIIIMGGILLTGAVVLGYIYIPETLASLSLYSEISQIEGYEEADYMVIYDSITICNVHGDIVYESPVVKLEMDRTEKIALSTVEDTSTNPTLYFEENGQLKSFVYINDFIFSSGLVLDDTTIDEYFFGVEETDDNFPEFSKIKKTSDGIYEVEALTVDFLNESTINDLEKSGIYIEDDSIAYIDIDVSAEYNYIEFNVIIKNVLIVGSSESYRIEIMNKQHYYTSNNGFNYKRIKNLYDEWK